MLTRLITMLLTATLCISRVAGASAGQIWTDYDGDGLPDPSTPFVEPAGSIVTVGLWIDAQSFQWTNYLAAAEWTPGALSFESASYVISGGVNFPINRFDQPNAVQFGGFGYDEGGIDLIGSITLRVNETVAACVTPIIDIESPLVSVLGAGPSYFLFTSNPGTCYGGDKGGACCLPNGVCQVMSPESCSSADGTYQGAGTDCQSVNCPQLPPERCCLLTGICYDLPPSACIALNGVPQGPGTSCDNGTCPEPLPNEACCFDCSCLDRPPDLCIALGGVPQGPGTTCGSVQCGDCTTQQCCLPDGSCMDITPDECAAIGGIAMGNGSVCGALPCPGTTACCFPDLTCLMISASECAAAGGNSIPGGVFCTQFDCSQASGACCFPDGGCSFVSRSACEQAGGLPYPNTACADVQCVPTATAPMSWGKVKGLFR